MQISWLIVSFFHLPFPLICCLSGNITECSSRGVSYSAPLMWKQRWFWFTLDCHCANRQMYMWIVFLWEENYVNMLSALLFSYPLFPGKRKKNLANPWTEASSAWDAVIKLWSWKIHFQCQSMPCKNPSILQRHLPLPWGDDLGSSAPCEGSPADLFCKTEVF